MTFHLVVQFHHTAFVASDFNQMERYVFVNIS